MREATKYTSIHMYVQVFLRGTLGFPAKGRAECLGSGLWSRRGSASVSQKPPPELMEGFFASPRDDIQCPGAAPPAPPSQMWLWYMDIIARLRGRAPPRELVLRGTAYYEVPCTVCIVPTAQVQEGWERQGRGGNCRVLPLARPFAEWDMVGLGLLTLDWWTAVYVGVLEAHRDDGPAIGGNTMKAVSLRVRVSRSVLGGRHEPPPRAPIKKWRWCWHQALCCAARKPACRVVGGGT